MFHIPSHKPNPTQKPEMSEHVASMVRVDHAGEYGAVQIYKGQRFVLSTTQHDAMLSQMQEHEEEHLKRFQGLINHYQVRPTVLSPLWHVGGFALGAFTALLGVKAAMACTVVVEELIEKHYQEQVDDLGDTSEKELLTTIKECQADEVEHRNIGVEMGAKDIKIYPLLHAGITAISKVAIFLSKRF